MRYLSQSAEGVRSLRRESVSCVVEVLWRMEESMVGMGKERENVIVVTFSLFGWCPEQDSNLHVSQHSHLKRARLPFRHLGFCGAKVESFFDTTSDYLEYFLLFCTSVWT